MRTGYQLYAQDTDRNAQASRLVSGNVFEYLVIYALHKQGTFWSNLVLALAVKASPSRTAPNSQL